MCLMAVILVLFSGKNVHLNQNMHAPVNILSNVTYVKTILIWWFECVSKMVRRSQVKYK